VTGTGGQTTVGSGTPYILQRLQSYVQIVNSPQVLQPVIDELGIPGLDGSVTALNPSGTVLLEVTATSSTAQRAADVANATAKQLINVIQDLESQEVGSSVLVKATVTQPASPPGGPSSPKPRINLIIGIMLGFVLGIGYAFLRNYLDNTVKTQEDLNTITGATSLGMVMFDPDAKENPLVTMDQRAVRSEAFRTIRTNLRYVNVDKPPRVITITSAVPEEGKSTTAINLAITLAQAGWSVCLVEADLRRPKMGKYLGVDMGVGLTSVLAGQNTLEEALLPWNRGMISLLPSGSIPPNPSELLSSKQMKDVLGTLRKMFNVVIVDAPPLLPVTDGAIVTTASDGCILVVRWGRTTREQLSAASKAIAQVDGEVLGTVMNFVPTSRRRYSYKYNYGYGYGYSSGYGESGSNEVIPAPYDAELARASKKDRHDHAT
ncbi:MAG: polysaccharide biosynthesis tyrosine autokinase, partial [bacterium]|nr:polysaccharide biosynthesis tyrosine autokinase [bacterium]